MASILRHWPSLAGLVIAGAGLFGFALLLSLDWVSPGGGSSGGVRTCLIAAAVGGGLAGMGLRFGPYRLTRRGLVPSPPPVVIDLSRGRDRLRIAFGTVAGLLFLLAVAVGSFHHHRYAHAREFRGETHRAAMKPEFATWTRSPHAHVACVRCHDDPGSARYVRNRVRGLPETSRAALDPFHRPSRDPAMDLRPAQEACERCHRTDAYVGDRERIHTYFLGDRDNTPFTVRLLLKVGGADPLRGPVGGIHWHLGAANRIEYIATGARNQVIPWVRMTDSRGVVTEFQTTGFEMKPGKHVVRRMDCMDCHNRCAHTFKSPNRAADLSLASRRIDPSIPGIKRAVETVLSRPYATREAAMRRIAAALRAGYSGDPRLETAIAEVRKIYRDNFFPGMKVDWRTYPDHIGHRQWSGCFRCHDGEHRTPDGGRTLKANDCRACHLILAQGRGAQLDKLNAAGWDFQHPGGGEYGDSRCVECHAAGE